MYLFCLFAAALVFFSYKSLRGGIAYLDFFKRELAAPQSDYAPYVSVIAPCRGLDADLEKNLGALFGQNFPAYEIIFAVDSETDESLPVIEKLISANAHSAVSASFVVAGKAFDEGQKVHNLRESVRRVSFRSKVFVFVDSDARPNEDWLRNLIAPLADETVGAATGYRWFVQQRGGLATHLRSVWNASIASALGASRESNFCWGGSMAMRRATFEKLAMREKWRGTLSDDFAVTRALKEAELGIYFVPQALAATVEDCSFKELFEFTTRQMKITRVYAAHLWANSLIGSSLFVLVWLWGLIILFSTSADSLLFWFAAASLSFVFAFSAGKSFLRLTAVKLVLKDYEKELNEQFLAQNTLWLATPALFLYNSLCALFSRRIRWRGITYVLRSHNSTEIVENKKPGQTF